MQYRGFGPRRMGAVSLALALLACGDGFDDLLDDPSLASVDSPAAPPPPLCRIALACEGDIPDEPKRMCGVRVQDGSGATVYDDMVGIERRGRSSLRFPKPNYSLELRDALGQERPTNLLGMGGDSDWILDGMWADRSLLRNELAFDMFRSLGQWAPRGRYCEVRLAGEPRGIYRLGERIKRDDDRIAIPEDDGRGQSFVIKQDDEGVLAFRVGEESRWKLVYPRQDRATDDQRRGVQAFLDELEAALQLAERSGEGQALLSLLDVDAAVDFVIVQELAKSVDAYNLSLHLWKAPGAPAQPVPWDFDLSMGQPVADNRPGHHEPRLWVWHRTLFSDGLSAVPEFRARLVERYRAHRAGPLSEAALMAHIDHALGTLTPAAVADNFRRWPLEEVDLASVLPAYALYPIASHDDEIAHIRTWLRERLAWMDANIEAYPED